VNVLKLWLCVQTLGRKGGGREERKRKGEEDAEEEEEDAMEEEDAEDYAKEHTGAMFGTENGPQDK